MRSRRISVLCRLHDARGPLRSGRLARRSVRRSQPHRRPARSKRSCAIPSGLADHSAASGPPGPERYGGRLPGRRNGTRSGHGRKIARVVLAQTDQVGFPRRGTWTGPERWPTFRLPNWSRPGTWSPRKTPASSSRLRRAMPPAAQWSPWLFVGRWGRTVHTRSDERFPNDRITRFSPGHVGTDMPLVLLTQPATPTRSGRPFRASTWTRQSTPAFAGWRSRTAGWSPTRENGHDSSVPVGLGTAGPATWPYRTSPSMTPPRPCTSRSVCPPA